MPNPASSIRHPTSATALPPDVVLSVRNVSKKFCRNLRRSMFYGIQDLTRSMLGMQSKPEFGNSDRSRESVSDLKPESGSETQVSSLQSPVSSLRKDEFWAVRDINFDLKRGECLGLIGRNGSGKSTLLRLLTGIFPPDSGEIVVRGRVGALIALGAGFHPHMTGRENIYLNGSILGLKHQEIEAQFDDIVDFADIGDFLEAPVSTYSSGMCVRLGFAVATASTPDLLLVDEVLAVGDNNFRAKCYQRLGKLLKHAAVIFVSHDMVQIGRICDRVMLMRQGSCAFIGDKFVGSGMYASENYSTASNCTGECKIWNPGLQVHSIRAHPNRIRTGGEVSVIVEYTANHSMPIPALFCNFVNETNLKVAEYVSAGRGQHFEFQPGKHVMEIPLGRLPLSRGRYLLHLVGFDEAGKVPLFHAYELPGIEVEGTMMTSAIIEMGPHI